MTFAFISLLSQSCSWAVVPDFCSFPVTIDHAFTLSSKVCILNFQLEKFIPSIFPDSWRYYSKLFFIFTQLNTPTDHHRASSIFYHRTEKELHYATTGQVRFAATEQIRDFTVPPPGKTDLLPMNRSTNNSNTPPPGKYDLLPPNRSRSCTAPPPGKSDLLPPNRSHSSNSPPPGRSDLLSPSGSRNPNSPPPGKLNLLPPSRNLHVPPPGKTDLQKIADFPKRKRLALLHSEKSAPGKILVSQVFWRDFQLKICANVPFWRIGALIPVGSAPMARLLLKCLRQPLVLFFIGATVCKTSAPTAASSEKLCSSPFFGSEMISDLRPFAPGVTAIPPDHTDTFTCSPTTTDM